MTIALCMVGIIAYLFIGNCIRCAAIRCWKTETIARSDGIAGLNKLTYVLRNKPTIGFCLLFPVTAHNREYSNVGDAPWPMVAEIGDQTTANWYFGMMLLFWPLKIVWNIIVLWAFFISFLFRHSPRTQATTWGQDLDRLRAKRDTASDQVKLLDKEIAKLEKEMVESQGGSVFRASEALERRRT